MQEGEHLEAGHLSEKTKTPRNPSQGGQPEVSADFLLVPGFADFFLLIDSADRDDEHESIDANGRPHR